MTQPTANPFSGSWQIVIAGDYTGVGTMNIDDQGDFSFSIVITGAGGTFTNTITGSVSNSGTMSADIYDSGLKVGTCSGNFSGNSGSGSYQTSEPSSGTWSATKL